MSSKHEIELGRPDERQKFIEANERFFEQLPNLQRALDAAFVKMNAKTSHVDIVIHALGNLCVDDFNQIILLCSNGFGNGALTILRGMFERLVVGRHLHLNPDDVKSFWNFHTAKLSKMGYRESLQKIDPDGARLNSFKAPAGKNGRLRLRATWLTKDFVKTATDVGLGEHINNAYYFPLEFAHPSVLAVLRTFEYKEGEVNFKDNEPQSDMAEIAFVSAHFFVLEVLRLQIEHFELDGDDPIYQQCLEDFVCVLKPESA